MNKSFLSIFSILFFILMVFSPDISYKGALSGIQLCMNCVIPALLPFLIIFEYYQIQSGSTPSCLFGWVCGSPLGAAMVDQSSHSGFHIRLALYNTLSPNFVITYLCISCLHQPQAIPLFLLSIWGGTILAMSTLRLLYQCCDNRKSALSKSSPSFQKVPGITSTINHTTNKTKSHTIDSSGMSNTPGLSNAILHSIKRMSILSGYVILSSILAAYLTHYLPPQNLYTHILLCIIEITTGISSLCETAQALQIPYQTLYPLLAFLLSFGCLSIFAQTFSVIQHHHCHKLLYILLKLCCGITSALLMSLLIYILRKYQ